MCGNYLDPPPPKWIWLPYAISIDESFRRDITEMELEYKGCYNLNMLALPTVQRTNIFEVIRNKMRIYLVISHGYVNTTCRINRNKIFTLCTSKNLMFLVILNIRTHSESA